MSIYLKELATILVVIIAGVSFPVTASNESEGTEKPLAESAGKQVFDKWCIHCHSAGESYPGTWKLALRADEESSVLTERKNLSPEYIAYIVRNGFAGMPQFRHVEISDQGLDDLVDFLVSKP